MDLFMAAALLVVFLLSYLVMTRNEGAAGAAPGRQAPRAAAAERSSNRVPGAPPAYEPPPTYPGPKSAFSAIADSFTTFEQLQEGLRVAGLESSSLIIGVDYTKSNESNGRVSFGGRSLHEIDATGARLNPYERAISVVGRTLEPFDDDRLIPAYGFGDTRTADRRVFPFVQDRPCNGFVEVLELYRRVTPTVKLSGPTNFAPLIREAIAIVQRERAYHILVILTDGEVVNVADTTAAIVEASAHPLSIVAIGLGDGPFDQLRSYDDELPERQFDNFQAVVFEDVMRAAEGRPNPDVAFAMAALMEIPQQYQAIRRLRLL